MLPAKLRAELGPLLNLYHIFNLLLSIAFPISKFVAPLPQLLYGQKQPGLDSREREILIFLAVVIVWKNRKSTNSLQMLSISYLFAKLANASLFFRASPLLGVLYSVLALLIFVLVPEPLPAESQKIHYFRGDELQRVLEEQKSTVWIIEFFAVWSPDCRYVAPVFSALAEKYTLPNLRFGKLDVGKYPEQGEHFRVNPHASSRQLPTVSVFKNGALLDRRPRVENQRAVPFVFNEQNLILALGLNSIYAECKARVRN